MIPSLPVFAETLVAWLIDYFLLATALLASAFIVLRFIRQPKRRLLIAWVVLVELTALAAVCALPHWPRISLLPATSPTAASRVSGASAVSPPPLAKAPKSPQSTENATGATVSISPTASIPATTINWPSLPVTVALAYVLGMTATALWLLWGALATRRLCTRATPAPRPLLQQLAHLVGPARQPRLLLSHHIGNAAAVGILRPTILLRAEFAQQQPPQSLHAMLAHEWAHIANRDLWLLALERALRVLLFAHPLYWHLRRLIRNDQETLADATAASANRHDYAQNLLDFARLSTDQPLRALAAAGILERPSQLSRRITTLLDETFHVHTSVSRRWKWPALILFLLFGAALSLMTLQPGCSLSNKAGNTMQTQNPPFTKVHVVDTDGKPIEGAKVHASIWTDEPFKANRDYTSDATGTAAAELPKSLHILRIWASKDGYIPIFTHWEQEWFNAGHPAPDEVTITLKTGTAIGGIVKNEDGQPIAGAKVGVTLDSDPETQTMVDHWLACGDDDRVTDAAGKWSLNNVPEGNLRFQISVTHPDYVSDLQWGGLQIKQGVTAASLRDQTATIVMQRGTSLTGRITDPQGRPVPGAIVIWGDNPYEDSGSHQEHRQQVRTDSNGAYRLQPLPRMPLTVTVVAQGWMPQLKKTTVAPENPTLDFQLQPGKTLRLKIVDRSGNPIPSAGVGIERWRGIKSLYNVKHPIVLETPIPRLADNNGIFEWTSAPDDPVQYTICKEGYQYITQSLTADNTEQTIQLRRQ